MMLFVNGLQLVVFEDGGSNKLVKRLVIASTMLWKLQLRNRYGQSKCNVRKYLLSRVRGNCLIWRPKHGFS